MKLKQIRTERRRLADEVYDQLLRAIQDNEIGKNERLVQERIAADLNISRTPVREALLRLEQDGILASSPRGGFLIHKINNDEVRELYQARAAIEGQAVRILAFRNEPDENEKLRATIEEAEKIPTPSVEAYFDANRTIHRRIVELSRNRYLLEMFDNIWNRGTSFQLFAAIEKVDLSKSLGDHMTLAEAIETGDPAHAGEVIIKHISDGFELQIEALEKEYES
ncbi:MAG: GntR family transcriptional regulator [Hyphomicrobiales bacterium]